MISKHCALVRQDGQIAVLNAAGVFFCIREHDRQGRRTALGMLSTHHLASVTELAAAFDVSRGTVYRCKEAYRAGGVDALKATRTSKGGYKLNGDTEVDPFQWTVYVLGFMQLSGVASRSPWVSDSPAPGDDGAGYTILR